MSRRKPNARERLQRAALELFVQQGFAETTVSQITARAGLTTRTFFRYFADKRAVLFGGEEELPALIHELMAEALVPLPPMAVVVHGLEAFATRFEGQRDYLRTRRAVIQTDEGLRERELRKSSNLAEAVTEGFLNRGLDKPTATLTAQIAVTIFNVSRWLNPDGEQPLAQHLHATLDDLQ